MQQRRPINEHVAREQERFMKSESNQMGAEHFLLQKADEKKWTKKEFMEHAEKRGYMKTEKDRQIVKHVLQKKKIYDHDNEDRRRDMEQRKKEEIEREIMRHSEIIDQRKYLRRKQ